MSGSILNTYGDQCLSAALGFGADISSQRIDDLDSESIAFASKLKKPFYAIDLGCGYGAHSARFAKVGANVIAVDIADQSANIAESLEKEGLASDAIRFMRINVLDDLSWMAPADIIYSQRMIHYFKFNQALNLMANLHRKLKTTGKLFISASGINSELGNGYPDKLTSLHDRFNTLNPEMAKKHGITSPVCLYSEEDLRNLLEQAGFRVTKIWASAFGNIKAIASYD